MPVTVAVIVRMAMPVVVEVVIVAAGMVVCVVMRRMGIGPAFRLERRLDRPGCGPKSRQQRLGRGLAPHPQPAGAEFGRDVPVPEMKGDTGEHGRVGRANLKQRLGPRDDLDERAVCEHKAIVGVQTRGRKARLDPRPAKPRKEGVRCLTLLEIKEKSIAYGAAAGLACPDHAGRAQRVVLQAQFKRSGRSGSPAGRLGGVTTSPSSSPGVSTAALAASSRRR